MNSSRLADVVTTLTRIFHTPPEYERVPFVQTMKIGACADAAGELPLIAFATGQIRKFSAGCRDTVPLTV